MDINLKEGQDVKMAVVPGDYALNIAAGIERLVKAKV